jgi:hypothetical protein
MGCIMTYSKNLLWYSALLPERLLSTLPSWTDEPYSNMVLHLLPLHQERLSLQMAQGQQGQDNTSTSATDLENLTNTIIPEAEEVNEANSQLNKICTDSPNSECDNTMITIYNDCVAYPAYVATHIPSCGDSRLFSYLVVRELLG